MQIRDLSWRVALLGVVLFLAACTYVITVKQHPVRNPMDIASQSTYRWDHSALAAIAPQERRSSLFDAVLRARVDEVLKAKGYRKITAASADFTVDYRITIQQQTVFVGGYSVLDGSEDERQFSGAKWGDQPPAYQLKWGFDQGGKLSFQGVPDAATEIQFYQTGTLHIGAFKPTGELSWHVSAEKILDERHSSAEHESILSDMVGRIMARFPRRKPAVSAK